MTLQDSRTERPDARWILGSLLVEHGTKEPEAPFLFEVDGPEYTYGEALDRSLRLAAALRASGVQPGDRVISMIENSADSVVVMGACALLSAVHVPINVAYVGYMLQHALAVAEPVFAFIQDEYHPRLADIDVPAGCTIAVRGETPRTAPGEVLNFADMLDTEPLAIADLPEVTWEDTGTFLFTSGTTGSSKAVVIPWLHLYHSSIGIWQGQELDSSARFYSPWPINHISGTGAAYLAILLRGSLVLRDKWSTSQFVEDINRYSCTVTTLMAEMTAYAETMDGIEDTTLEHVFAAPILDSTKALFARMGVSYCTNYNSTETNSPIGSVGHAPVPSGSCGQLRPGNEVRIVDEDGKDVPTGANGELLIRTTDEFAMNRGYWGMPEQTADAWQDGWFHTGDLVRVDENGDYWMAGRLKDRIRVRGENVNPDELEMVVKGSKHVSACSAVGVPLDGGEDEIHLFVIPSDHGFDNEAIRAYCDEHLPKFMRPAHIHEVVDLPATPTGKVQRAVLRDRIQAARDASQEQQ